MPATERPSQNRAEPRDQIATFSIDLCGREENEKAQAAPAAGHPGIARPSGKEDETTTTSKNSKASKAARVGQLIAGTNKRLPNGNQTITLDGATTTVDAVTKELQSYLDDRNAVVAAQATAKATVAAENANMPALNALLKAFIAFVRVNFGNDPSALADFGLTPHQAPQPMTAEAKAAAVAKREATRAARGTKTPKQKKGIHGNVTAKLVVTPVETVPATAPAPDAAAAPATTPNKG
ncbi:MAG TPA: hypothetical protein VF765_08960 [Polyangiaceae bacterium]